MLASKSSVSDLHWTFWCAMTTVLILDSPLCFPVTSLSDRLYITVNRLLENQAKTLERVGFPWFLMLELLKLYQADESYPNTEQTADIAHSFEKEMLWVFMSQCKILNIRLCLKFSLMSHYNSYMDSHTKASVNPWILQVTSMTETRSHFKVLCIYIIHN